METFLHDHPYEFCYQQELITAACIHDIGKHYIPNEILNAPRRLTIKEREIIDLHAYDALTSKRSYHEKYSDEMAMDIIASSKEFDREAVALFADWEGRK